MNKYKFKNNLISLLPVRYQNLEFKTTDKKSNIREIRCLENNKYNSSLKYCSNNYRLSSKLT